MAKEKQETMFSAGLLDELLEGQDPATVLRSDGLVGDLKKALAERMLNAEMERFELFNACRPMRLVIEYLSPRAAEIGLTQGKLQAAVESRLSAARLYTEDRERADSLYLYVKVTVAARAFSINLAYKKRVTDAFEGFGWATTWDNNGTGTHGGEASYIVGLLSQQYMDQFIANYLRVNEAVCG